MNSPVYQKRKRNLSAITLLVYKSQSGNVKSLADGGITRSKVTSKDDQARLASSQSRSFPKCLADNCWQVRLDGF